MLVFLVTGVAGAGKSTVARRLFEWGHWAVSLDADDLLCSWTDPRGRRVPRPQEPDAAWLAGHRWVWDPARLDEIISEAARGGTDCLWLCGSAANGLQVTDRFAECFLLDIDQKTMARRLRSRTGGNDFGRLGDTLPAALASHTEFLAAARRDHCRRHRARGQGRRRVVDGRGDYGDAAATGRSFVHAHARDSRVGSGVVESRSPTPECRRVRTDGPAGLHDPFRQAGLPK